jgi:DNA-binding transcriptional MerR regulator
VDKAPDAFRTISEVADDLQVPQHVLRFWESRFTQIKPLKRGGGRRYYRPEDINLLRGIRHLLYGEGYTIRGVQRILREQGPRFVQGAWQEGATELLRASSHPEDFEADENGEADGREDRAHDVARPEPAAPPRPSRGQRQTKLTAALEALSECRELLGAVLAKN